MCKSRCSLPKNVRLQVIIGILENVAQDRGLSTLEIHEIATQKGVEVSLRTIQRDLNEVSLFAPISEEERDGTLYWLWIGGELVEKLSYLDKFWRNQFVEFSKGKEAS